MWKGSHPRNTHQAALKFRSKCPCPLATSSASPASFLPHNLRSHLCLWQAIFTTANGSTAPSTHGYDLLVGADGTASRVRAAVQQSTGINVQVRGSSLGYGASGGIALRLLRACWLVQQWVQFWGERVSKWRAQPPLQNLAAFTCCRIFLSNTLLTPTTVSLQLPYCSSFPFFCSLSMNTCRCLTAAGSTRQVHRGLQAQVGRCISGLGTRRKAVTAWTQGGSTARTQLACRRPDAKPPPSHWVTPINGPPNEGRPHERKKTSLPAPWAVCPHYKPSGRLKNQPASEPCHRGLHPDCNF